LSLSSRIFLGLGAGIAAGLFFGEPAGALEPFGKAFIGLLQMTVLPYVTVSLIGGIGRLEPAGAQLLAMRAGGFLLLLWALAIAAALAMPLAFPAWSAATFFSASLLERPPDFDLVDLYIPANPFHALANNVVPAVVLFSGAVGVALIGVERKQPLLDVLDGIAAALERVNDFVARLTPLGVFALAASAAGTLTLEQLERLQVYFASYVALSSFLALWVLPGLAAALLPLSWRSVVVASRDALLTAFATGSVVLVLPLLVERARTLLVGADPRGRQAATGVDVVVPAAVSFPNAAKLLALSFVLFAGWFSGQEIGLARYPRLVVAGVASLFGNVNSAIPFLLDLLHVPADMMQLFVATSVVNARFGSLLGAMHVLVLALLGAGAGVGLVRAQAGPLARWAVVTLLGGGAVLGGTRLLFERTVAPPPPVGRLLAEMHLVADPVPSAVLREALPAPDPPALAALPAIERAVARGRLRACFRDEMLPLSYRNAEGALVGYDVELAHMLARELGLGLDFVPARLEELPERLRAGACDVAMTSVAVTTLRSLALTFAPPHLEGTLGFLVEDHRREEFSSRAAVQALPHPRLAGPNAPYYVDIVKHYLPRAEIEVVDSPREFIERRRGDFDAYVVAAELGAAWTLRFPEFTVAIPQPDLLAVPMAYSVAHGDLASAHHLGTWIALKRSNGTLARLYERWVLGRSARARAPRWSVLRDVLGVRDAGASDGAPEPASGLGDGR